MDTCNGRSVLQQPDILSMGEPHPAQPETPNSSSCPKEQSNTGADLLGA